ncbi:MAG: hypothetical protein IPK15_08500 [Verrucomicrobia bacterium]|nr:hypothetical protein [Verrucomicrobiota bacterium]
MSGNVGVRKTSEPIQHRLHLALHFLKDGLRFVLVQNRAATIQFTKDSSIFEDSLRPRDRGQTTDGTHRLGLRTLQADVPLDEPDRIFNDENLVGEIIAADLALIRRRRHAPSRTAKENKQRTAAKRG